MSPKAPTPTSPRGTATFSGKDKGETAPKIRKVAQNRRARHDYDIIEVFECGIELRGSEVKSLRLGQGNIQEAFARIDGGEVWLVQSRISAYEYSNGFGAVDPERRRKLLLHRHQIDELRGKMAQQSLTLVPLSIYFKDGRAKVELGLAKGRHNYDKRRVIAEREANRDTERAIREFQRR
jgi:SsrA-binding protein